MEDKLEKILEIKVDVGEAIKGIDSLNAAIAEQKKRQQELKEQIKQLEEAEGDNTDAIAEMREAYILSQQKVKDYNSQIQGLSKSVQNQLKIDRENIGSMQQLRAQLSNLTKAYDSLSAEEREAAKGQELKDKINQVTDALKNSEEATQRYYRNVGNYENAIKNSLGLNSKFGQTLNSVADATKNGLSPALKEATAGVKNVGVQAMKLLANPIVAIVAAIAAAIMLVVKGIKSSEENTAKLKTITAAFKPVLDVVTKALQWFADKMLDVVGWIGKAVGGFSKLLEKLPGVGDEMKKINEESARYVQLEKDKQKLVERNRELIVSNAKAEMEVTELKVKAKDKELYTDQERLKFIQDANKIEERVARERKEAAEENLRILKEEARATQNSAEINDELARAEAEVYNAVKDYNNKRRELLEQENAIKNEIAAEDKARADERKKQEKERNDKQREYLQLLQEEKMTADEMFLQLQEGETQLIALEDLRYEKEVKGIKEKQKQYEDNIDLYNEYAAQLVAAELIHQKNIDEITAEYDQQRIEREANEKALKLAEDERAFQNEIAQLKLQGEKYEQAELDLLQWRVDNIYKLEEETEQEFRERKIAAEQALLDKKKKNAEEEVKIQKSKEQALSGIAGSISKILEATAGDDLKRLKAAKIAALAEIAINQGLAIANAVKAVGAAVPPIPFPINVAMIASSVASAVTAIAPAIQAVNSVKLARGGHVSGPGTSTSDSVPAMLSNGEFVVNARATSMFPDLLETINNFGLGIASPARLETAYQTRQEAMTLDMMVKAFQHLPRPVVSVEEITRAENRVDALENLTRLG